MKAATCSVSLGRSSRCQSWWVALPAVLLSHGAREVQADSECSLDVVETGILSNAAQTLPVAVEPLEGYAGGWRTESLITPHPLQLLSLLLFHLARSVIHLSGPGTPFEWKSSCSQ